MKKEFSECNRCNKQIHFGEEHMTISRMIEVAEFIPKRNRIESQPLDAFDIVHLCNGCGKLFDESKLKGIIETMPDKE